MAGDYGTLTSLGDTDAMVRQVLSLVPTLDPKMHVLLNLVDTGEPVTGISGKLEWLEKNVHALKGTINEDLDNSETGVDVATGEGLSFGKGDIFLIGTEYFQVVSVATDTLTVATRGSILGSAAATHANGATWKRIGNATEEDTSFVARGFLDVTPYCNWRQQFVFTYKETLIAQGLKNYGGGTKLADMVVDGLIACRSDLNRMMYHGVRAQYSSGVSGIMGGLATFIPKGNSATDYSSDPVSEAIINGAFEDIMDTSGDRRLPATLLCTYPMKQAIGHIYRALNAYNRAAESNAAGMKIETIVTPYGDVELVADRDCQVGRIYFANLSDIKVHSVSGVEWQKKDTDTSATVTERSVLGAYTMSVLRPKSMIYLNGLSEAY